MRRALLAAAVLVGVGARLYLTVARPLWSDEIFTLGVARQSLSRIVESLRVDSGPPLHYLLSRLVLLPFVPTPGPHDVAVRVVSLAASLLHLPLLLLVARRLGRPEAGPGAAALYALFPIAVSYAAEGRAYAVASLLALAAFERALALREAPTACRSVGLALAAGAAVLSHYLALFPIAGLLVLLPRANRGARVRMVLALAGGAFLFLPWLPTALGQPAASMAWARASLFADAPFHFPVNLTLAIPPGPNIVLLLPLALFLLGAALILAWRGPMRPAASALLAGILLLIGAHLLAGPFLLPERPAVLFLPLVALLLAGAPWPFSLASAAVSLAGLVSLLRGAAAPTPGQTLASLVAPELKSGRSVCAAALWGPELDYRLARAGLPGRVVLFPSDVARHPGWLSEENLDAGRLAAEARALVASPSRPALYVLPKNSRSAEALRAELAPLGARPVASGPLADLVALP